MSDTDKNVAYAVTADPGDFEKGMQKAASAAKGAAGQIDTEFKKIGDAFSQVQKSLLLLAGVVAGGAFFKEAISASNQLTGEVLKLSKGLGITGEEAGTLNTALGDIGSSGEDYIAVFTKFARQLKSNEDGLKTLGIQTRDSNGDLRDSKTLFTEALGSVGQYKAGLDQNTYAQTVFGKSIDEVMKLQKLSNAVMEEAKRKNEELGLVVTKDNVEASKAYKLAMNDVNDVLLAVKKVVGDAVMPVFTELGVYFSSAGPYVVDIFKGALMGLLTAFEVVKGAVKTVAGAVFEAFNTIVESSALLGKTMIAFIKGQYSEAWETGKQLGERLKQGYTNSMQNFKDSGDETGDAIKKHFQRLYGKGNALAAPTGGAKRMGDFKNTNGGKDQSRTGQWDAELAEAKLAYQEQNNIAGTFYQFSKQEELKFWQDKLSLTAKGTNENLTVRRKLADLQLSIGTDSYNHEIAALQAQEANFKQNMAARMALLDQQASLVKQRFGTESKEYEEVQKQIVETKRQTAEQLKQIDLVRSDSVRNAQLAELASAEQQAQLERDLRLITDAELLTRASQFENSRYQVQAQALQERLQLALADPDRSVVEVARINAELEELERQHQLRLGQIRGDATRESQKYTTQMYGSMESGLAGVIQKSLVGGQTLAGLWRGVWQVVVQAVTQALAQMAAQWLLNTIMSKVLSKGKALTEISANAGIAGSAAVASTAAIPIIGPFLAPAAGIAAFSTAMAYQGVAASAAGGYDIPSTINPLVQAHASEMILPAKHADVIRRLADGDRAASQAAAPVAFHITAMDARSVRDFFNTHGASIVDALHGQRRNFKF
jgi:hypothetical protein